ncbi:MAG: SAM-dependent chlorinase/fluorinase [Candidatus Bathyarchaeia archaeon]
MKPKVIALLSDFGLKDPYVAEMKAVILDKCPDAKIVDISHEVGKFDIRMGAFILASAAPYFPEGTVHVAVVDPSVGTQRRPVIVETGRGFFVGPDNGVIMLAALREGLTHVYVIENSRFMLPRVSRTFHGRDVFAPTAAHLALGVDASEFWREIRDYMMPEFANPVLKENTMFGEVLHVDDFGNIITNISSDTMKKLTFHENESLQAKLGKKTATLRLCSAYGEVAKGKPLLILGSHDFLEISVNQGNAARLFGIKRGDLIRVRRRV